MEGSFQSNPALLGAMRQAIDNRSTLHLAGLIGTGTIHAYEQHLYALIEMARNLGVKKIALHLFSDGRDSPAKTAIASVKNIEKKIEEWQEVSVASVTGRFYAMDRGLHLKQTEAAINAIVFGQGDKFLSASEALEQRYQNGMTDEMIPPSVIVDKGDFARGLVHEGDAAIFFNYRNDRMIQLVKMFFERAPKVKVATMTAYSPTLAAQVAFPPLEIKDTLSEIISNKGLKQFHAAESEKFAHVTFFFNGHRHEPWPGEERFIVKSPEANIKNYVDVPEMSAKPLTDEVVKRIRESDDSFILVNYANGDMVGHTGDLDAVKKAVLTLDQSLQRLAEAASDAGALLMITADHGNCEQMVNITSGEVDTEHSTNPVPLIFYADDLRFTEKSNINLYTLAGIVPEGILPDIAPTVLSGLGIEVPMAMTGKVIEI